MKKITLYFLLITSVFYSQNNNGIAVYKIIFNENKKIIVSKNIKANEMMAKINDETTKLRPKLKFNTKQAVFYVDGLSNIEAEMASASYCNCYTSKYTDLVSQKTYQPNEAGIVSDEGEYLIERPILNNWTITGEKKLIDVYSCIKATQTIYTADAIKQEITAWFCPDFNIPFGPAGYAGLPGLIIELRQVDVVFALESLKIAKELIVIKIPKKGKLITFDNYYNLSKKRIEELKIEQNK